MKSIFFTLFGMVLVLTALPAQAQSPDCSQVVNEVKKFTTRVNENNSAVATFVGEVSVEVDRFYYDYSQFEDQTVAIALDYFYPLKQAADGIGETVNVAYDQLAILDEDGQALVKLVEACMGTSPTP